jgi:putative ABC transport system substrate-binding protein
MKRSFRDGFADFPRPAGVDVGSGVTRRTFILAAAAWPALALVGAAFAQSKKPPVVIGWLSAGLRPEAGGGNLAELKKELATLGWQDGANYVLEELYAAGQRNRLPALAEELAAKKAALIVATPSVAAIAAAKAVPRMPIVQVGGASPVDTGLAASLARPGGMVTGLTSLSAELSAKFLELLLAAVPKVKRVGFLVDAKTEGYATQMKNAHAAIERFRIEARFAEVGSAEGLDRALAQLAKEGVQALVVLPSGGLFNPKSQRILQFALSQRWPVIGSVGWGARGALLSYSTDVTFQYRRAAHYVDRILKGAKPADLPIEQPMHFELVVNLKTAKALGLTMPPEIMVQATRVIQ